MQTLQMLFAAPHAFLKKRTEKLTLLCALAVSRMKKTQMATVLLRVVVLVKHSIKTVFVKHAQQANINQILHTMALVLIALQIRTLLELLLLLHLPRANVIWDTQVQTAVHVQHVAPASTKQLWAVLHVYLASQTTQIPLPSWTLLRNFVSVMPVMFCSVIYVQRVSRAHTKKCRVMKLTTLLQIAHLLTVVVRVVTTKQR